MQLTKKQVKALLEVLSKDNIRPILQQASVSQHDGKIYLVATDSYQLVALRLDDNSYTDMISKRLSRGDLTKWYKLANAKDVLTEAEMYQMLTIDPAEAGTYPDIWACIDRPVVESSKVGINPRYMLNMNDLSGTELVYNVHGTDPRYPMYKCENSNGIFTIMGIKLG